MGTTVVISKSIKYIFCRQGKTAGVKPDQLKFHQFRARRDWGTQQADQIGQDLNNKEQDRNPQKLTRTVNENQQKNAASITDQTDRSKRQSSASSGPPPKLGRSVIRA